MKPGEMYRFSDNAFNRGDPMNGQIFLIIRRTPPKIEGMSHAVDILVDGQVKEWSERALFNYIEYVGVHNEAG